jgi:hypothetical protein
MKNLRIAAHEEISDAELLGEGAEPGSAYWIHDEHGPSGVREVKSGHTVEWA